MLNNVKLHKCEINNYAFQDIRAGEKRFVVIEYNKEYDIGHYIIFNDCTALFKITSIFTDISGETLNKDYCILGFKLMEVVE